MEGGGREMPSGGHLPRNAVGVRIELEVASDRVLLSDFDLWHYALNYWYLPASIADERAFDARLKPQGLCYYLGLGAHASSVLWEEGGCVP